MEFERTRRPHWTVLLVVCLWASHAHATDWPTYRHDNFRSGKTPESVEADRLQPQWTYHAPGVPQRAWAGPAKWDAYAGIRGLRSMRNYDPVFHMIAVGGRIYFGSTVDDAVHCLNAETGAEEWVYITDGPVRIAPAFHDGKLYFGSDDGAAYCVEATTGQLVWKFRPIEAGRLILHQGKFIPMAPIRTGILVDAGTAYFAAGLFPWDASYLCAVDADSGKVEGEGRFVRQLEQVTFEGPLLCSLTSLIAPQGRVPPILFERKTGAKRKQLSGGGGSFVLVTDDDRVLHGPGNKTGWITDSNVKGAAKLAAFQGANAIVVHGDVSYVLGDTQLSAIDRKSKKPIWTTPCEHPYDLILAGDTLFAGGLDEVAAFRAGTGELIARYPVLGKAQGLVVADGGLFIATDEGKVACLRPGEKRAPKAAQKTAPVEGEAPLAPIEEVKEQGLLGRWVFQRNALVRGHFVDQAGTQNGMLKGHADFIRLGDREALRSDGSTTLVQIAGKHTEAKVPTRAFTAMAWVRVDQPKTWGSFIGAIQDNGDFERGFLLGYLEDHFGVAVCGKEGPARLTYLTAKTKFTKKAWYFVAGTYDGQTLKLYVDGKLEVTSNEPNGDIHYPPEAPFVMGAYRDKDEFFPLDGALHEVRLYDRALSATTIADLHTQTRDRFPKKPKELLAVEPQVGPYLQFTSPTMAIVTYQTEQPCATTLELRLGERRIQRHHDAAATTDHSVTLTGLRNDTQYEYLLRLPGDEQRTWSKVYECDTFFNYTLPPIDGKLDPYPDDAQSDKIRMAARAILQASDVQQGICLVLGCGQGQLAYELARQSGLKVIGVDTDPARVAHARRLLRQAKCYGTRINIYQVEALDRLPFTDAFANLVVSESMLTTGEMPAKFAEVANLVRPDGGVAYLGLLKQNREKLHRYAGTTEPSVTVDATGGWLKWTRPALPKSGVWSHLYGLPDNAAFAGEHLNGIHGVSDLEVQWIGRPGPRAQPDRNGRKPSPLSINGRLFVQGLERLIALDAHNGSILWSLEIPPLARFNMPRDCGNWCVDPEFVYLSIRDRCWKIDAATGQVVAKYSVLEGPRDWPYEWGYLARVDEHLVGSSVKKGTSHTNYWGGASSGWYDSQTGEVTFPVCSDQLFSLDPARGKTRWTYHNGVILHPTISIADGRVFFVECRHPKVLESDTRRVGLPELWQEQHLMALDLDTGKVVWDQPIDTVDGTVVFYMLHAEDRLVIMASQKQYHTYAFDAKDGRKLWETTFAWQNGDHGGHMSRPAVVGGKVYVRPRVLDLASGKLLPETLPKGGCGTYACSINTLIFRAGEVTVWDRDAATASKWTRLRPDCWLSTIPACGLVLSPEGGGGCSCGSWMETSLAFRPKNR